MRERMAEESDRELDVKNVKEQEIR